MENDWHLVISIIQQLSNPFFKKIVPGMGMTRDTVTGNMIIEFEIEFPDTLTPEQTEQLSTIL
jgi:DnaJ-class molecular chaperone